MRTTVYRTALLASMMLLASCTSQRVLNLSDTPLPARADGAPHTMAEVQNAILSACNQRGWVASVQSEGVIAASLMVRAHRADVTIPYTPIAVSILYRDSRNLDHHDNRIHRNYNHWVANLYRTIVRNLGSRAQYY